MTEMEHKKIYLKSYRIYDGLVLLHQRIHVTRLPNYKSSVTRILPTIASSHSVMVVIMKLVPALVIVWVLQVTLVSAMCLSSHGPSPYEFDIDRLMTRRETARNLVAGWRQYDDRLLFR
jgi:hypothetical protein